MKSFKKARKTDMKEDVAEFSEQDAHNSEISEEFSQKRATAQPILADTISTIRYPLRRIFARTTGFAAY